MHVSPDENMRAARAVELETMRVAAEEEIRDQEAVGGDGDPEVVALRVRKVEQRKADLAAINEELETIRSHGKKPEPAPMAAPKPKKAGKKAKRKKASKK